MAQSVVTNGSPITSPSVAPSARSQRGTARLFAMARTGRSSKPSGNRSPSPRGAVSPVSPKKHCRIVSSLVGRWKMRSVLPFESGKSRKRKVSLMTADPIIASKCVRLICSVIKSAAIDARYETGARRFFEDHRSPFWEYCAHLQLNGDRIAKEVLSENVVKRKKVKR